MSNYNLYVLFNKHSKQVVSFTFDTKVFPENVLENFLIKEIPFEQLGIKDNTINLARFRWVGDFDSGRVVDMFDENLTVVSEKEIDKKYYNIFYKKYTLDDIIYELILNCDMKTEKGQNIQNFLKKTLDKKEKEKNFYKNSSCHIWEGAQEVQQRQKKAFLCK